MQAKRDMKWLGGFGEGGRLLLSRGISQANPRTASERRMIWAAQDFQRHVKQPLVQSERVVRSCAILEVARLLPRLRRFGGMNAQEGLFLGFKNPTHRRSQTKKFPKFQ